MLWLTGIKLATNSHSVNAWVLVVAGISFALALVAGLLGLKFHRQKAYAKAMFLWGLPISPLLFSLSVLGTVPVELYGRREYGAVDGALAAPVLLAKAVGPLVAAIALSVLGVTYL